MLVKKTPRFPLITATWPQQGLKLSISTNQSEKSLFPSTVDSIKIQGGAYKKKTVYLRFKSAEAYLHDFAVKIDWGLYSTIEFSIDQKNTTKKANIEIINMLKA